MSSTHPPAAAAVPHRTTRASYRLSGRESDFTFQSVTSQWIGLPLTNVFSTSFQAPDPTPTAGRRAAVWIRSHVSPTALLSLGVWMELLAASHLELLRHRIGLNKGCYDTPARPSNGMWKRDAGVPLETFVVLSFLLCSLVFFSWAPVYRCVEGLQTCLDPLTALVLRHVHLFANWYLIGTMASLVGMRLFEGSAAVAPALSREGELVVVWGMPLLSLSTLTWAARPLLQSVRSTLILCAQLRELLHLLQHCQSLKEAQAEEARHEMAREAAWRREMEHRRAALPPAKRVKDVPLYDDCDAFFVLPPCPSSRWEHLEPPHPLFRRVVDSREGQDVLRLLVLLLLLVGVAALQPQRLRLSVALTLALPTWALWKTAQVGGMTMKAVHRLYQRGPTVAYYHPTNTSPLVSRAAASARNSRTVGVRSGLYLCRHAVWCGMLLLTFGVWAVNALLVWRAGCRDDVAPVSNGLVVLLIAMDIWWLSNKRARDPRERAEEASAGADGTETCAGTHAVKIKGGRFDQPPMPLPPPIPLVDTYRAKQIAPELLLAWTGIHLLLNTFFHGSMWGSAALLPGEGRRASLSPTPSCFGALDEFSVCVSHHTEVFSTLVLPLVLAWSTASRLAGVHYQCPLLRPIRNVLTDGVYDLYHAGHKKVMRKALLASHRGKTGLGGGNCLIAGVCGDEACVAYKRLPIMSTRERVEEVRESLYAAITIPYYPVSGVTESILRYYRIHVMLCGEEYYHEKDTYYLVARHFGVLDTAPRTEGISTTDIIHRIREDPA